LRTLARGADLVAAATATQEPEDDKQLVCSTRLGCGRAFCRKIREVDENETGKQLRPLRQR